MRRLLCWLGCHRYWSVHYLGAFEDTGHRFIQRNELCEFCGKWRNQWKPEAQELIADYFQELQ